MTSPDRSQSILWDEELGPILGREHLETAFNTDLYLRDFYTRIDDSAMKMVWSYLPNIVARMRDRCRVLDVGAGPTINVAVCFREKAKSVYLSDYLVQNRQELLRWYNGKSRFDWTNTLKCIALHEGNSEARKNLSKMEDDARRKLKGILACDIHNPNVIPQVPKLRDGFDVITSFFCIEYACKTESEYRNAIANVVRLLRPGGHIILGGVLEETWCAFGGVKFSQLFLTEDVLLQSLEAAGINTGGEHFIYWLFNGIYVVCGKKYPFSPPRFLKP